ncbi:MarR family winged helix-turn-helix transcriptional regulator [Paenibacillus mucilaginosus]|uniref:MarR family winged helix-turn-helix transcriptional regulator n=1 Tax=Paenibacillus mucilaginosus TaxID=61624 RepID=UPI00059FDE28|nr:MarR family transcriptional regulator [Paenibacillus mucilaginosus]WDM31295.1 MarR family transcriptional regulator [Paenibacillus mucilaginosus]
MGPDGRQGGSGRLLILRIERDAISNGVSLFHSTKKFRFHAAINAFQQPITQKALSEKLLIDKTTTAKAVTKLEDEGYVRREANPADNRYQLLYLTDSGREVVPKVKEALARVKNKTRQGMTDEQYEMLLGLLKVVLRNLTEQEEM